MLHRSLRSALPFVLFLSACVGPPAPDVEICRDVISRVCAQPVCTSAAVQLNLPTMDCEATLQTRTTCADVNFTFTSPTRNRFLECRLPLVRESTTVGAKPSCDNVDESFRNCPDLVRFLGGTP
jgi:hypothetical protein